MSGDNDDKWFVMGGHTRAKKRQDAPAANEVRSRPSKRGQGPAEAASKSASTAGGSAMSSISVHREWAPLKPGQADGGRSLRLLVKRQHHSVFQQRPPRKHPKAGPIGGSSQRGSQYASTSGAVTAWRKGARDPRRRQSSLLRTSR